MTTINQLSALDALSSGDQLAVWSAVNGDTRRAAIDLIAAWIEANTSIGALTTQYAAPAATGFSVTVSTNTHLILTPAAGYAAGTIVLPASPVDRDEFLCNCTQVVTTLTINGNGKTVTGGPTTLAANAFFRLKYDGVLSIWYRVG
jgi:hypothetical protein